MRRRATGVVLLALLGACLADGVPRPGDAAVAQPKELVDVELASGKLPVVTCSGRVTVLDADGRIVAELSGLAAGEALTAELGRTALGERPLGPPPITLHPAPGARLSAGGVAYRGDFRLEWSTRRAAPRLLNRLELDDYLLGVVPAEMPDRFGFEALKAQAVAARSYALSEMSSLGFLFSDTRSQAYGGVARETVLASRAVRETRGEVLVHAGRVVRAWYHSTCGGSTVAARDVFDDATPGVLDRAVECPDCKASPFWSWERSWDGPDVCAALGLAVAPLESAAAPAARWPARPAVLAAIAGEGTASTPIEALRRKLSAGRPLAKQMLSTQLDAPPVVRDGKLVLHGRGYGHGVGLCQYGAAGFAARGGSHVAILDRYYPGATLARRP